MMMSGGRAIIMWRWHKLIGVLQTLLLFTAPIFGQYQDGDVLLVGGSYQWEGRVEIYFSGIWGTITDSEWTNNDAQVVCRKMGHFKPGATAHSNAYFGEGKGTIHLDSVECFGSEYIVTECETKNSQTSNSHSFDVGVKCQPADEPYRAGDIRLVGGDYNWEGRVEIFWFGRWGTISDSSWTTNEAIVVCRQLQHSTEGVLIPSSDVYGEGVGYINIRDVTCDGSQLNITSCPYLNNTVRTSHQYDVQVQCQQGNEVKEGEIRLNGTRNLPTPISNYGRVEIFLSGVWGTVCDDGSGYNDARVVCRQLGYYTYDMVYYCCARFGQGTGPIHLEIPQCNGLEHRLIDCQYDNITLGDTHAEDWGIHCSIDGPEPEDIRLNGYVEAYLFGRWLPVANTYNTWTQTNSEIVCRELGYANVTTWQSTTYSTNYNQVDNVVCTGTEQKLSECNFVVVPDSNMAVRVTCENYDCRTGDMRVVDGRTEAEGRVEICRSYRWGTVCDNQWTDRHTAVVCRYLGFSDIIGDSTYFTSEEFGRGTGPIFMDYVNCTGSEARLWGKCKHFTHSYGYSHNNDVGVRCQPASCSNGQIKLIEGGIDYLYRGRVEICSNQRWETLNFYTWTPSTANVACLELGFSFYSNWRTTGFGRGGGPIHQNYYQCSGTELRLSECNSYNETTVRSHSYDVGIYCRLASCVDGELRLSEGKTEYEGRLEVCFSGRWGTVGSEEWSQVNSEVVCNSFGYNITDKKDDESIPSITSKPVYLHNILCTNRDLALLECSFTRYPRDPKTVSAAIIKCQPPTCKDGDIRLVGGASEFEGRLEICFGQRWTTIDGNGWTHTDTEVACSELGLSTSDISYTKIERTRYSHTLDLPVSITLVGCYSMNKRLTDCAYHNFPSTSTTTSMDVSISCQSSNDEVEPNYDEVEDVVDPTEIKSSELSSVSMASLTVAVICAIAVVILVAILIIMFFLRRRKNQRNHKDTELTSHHTTHETDTGGRYSTSNFTTTTTGNKSLNDKKVNLEDDIPMDSYEEMEAPNVAPLPPKPQPKKAPKKPTVAKNVDPTRYKKPPAPKPAMVRPPMHPHHPVRFQQQPRPPSPEAIYEVPD